MYFWNVCKKCNHQKSNHNFILPAPPKGKYSRQNVLEDPKDNITLDTGSWNTLKTPVRMMGRQFYCDFKEALRKIKFNNSGYASIGELEDALRRKVSFTVLCWRFNTFGQVMEVWFSDLYMFIYKLIYISAIKLLSLTGK